MIFNKRIICFLILITCYNEIAYPQGVDARVMNARLGRAINFGNALEAPNEGEWGVTLREEYFQIIKDGGFDGVRIPIKWNAHAGTEPPYTIDPAFFDRIDWAVNNALSRGLVAIIDFHHYYEIHNDPNQYHKERFLALWAQITDHYQNYPDELLFELLNEPNGKLTDTIWNGLLLQAIEVIRHTNPDRNIIIGGTGWNGKWQLINKLKLPPADRHIIATFHHYDPFHFTHQGAEWVSGSDAWLGTTWEGTQQQKEDITDDFNDIYDWSIANDRPVFMGEFGAYSKADMNSRILWTDFSSRQAEVRGFSWAYWEFCAGFGVYNDDTGKWNQLHRALVPNAPVQNQIRNYEFDFGTDHWWKWTSGGGAASISAVTGAELSGMNALKVSIDNGGSASSSVMAIQSNLQLESGKSYRISFMAKADSSRTIQTNLQERGGDWTVHWQRQQQLTTTPKTFSYIFNCPVTDSKVDMNFLLGGNSVNVYIDKVIVKEAWSCEQIIEAGLRLPADIRGPGEAADCYVNMYDLSVIAEDWLTDDSPADISGPDGIPDGIVDFYDFATIAEKWLKCNNLQDLGCDI
jgi:endoglucanase